MALVDFIGECQSIFHDTHQAPEDRVYRLVQTVILRFAQIESIFRTSSALDYFLFLLLAKLDEWTECCSERNLADLSAALTHLKTLCHPCWQWWTAPDLVRAYQKHPSLGTKTQLVAHLYQCLCQCPPTSQSPAVFAADVRYMVAERHHASPETRHLWRDILDEYSAKWVHTRCHATVCGRGGARRPCFAPPVTRKPLCPTHEKKRQRLHAALQRHTPCPDDLLRLVEHYAL